MTYKEIVKDQRFEAMGEVKADGKRRVGLERVKRANERYRVFENALGQIILDPMVSVPASEAWIYRTPGVAASIERGLRQSEQGKRRRMPSLAKHAHDDIG